MSISGTEDVVVVVVVVVVSFNGPPSRALDEREMLPSGPIMSSSSPSSSSLDPATFSVRPRLMLTTLPQF